MCLLYAPFRRYHLCCTTVPFSVSTRFINRFPTKLKMKPNLLMRAWMMAHLYGAEYQAVVCYAGSSGEVAFRESLCPQYTSDRHDAKGLRTYHITGTCGGTSISRIACGHIGHAVPGVPDNKPLRITVTSNTHAWQGGDLEGVDNGSGIPEFSELTRLDLNVERLVEIPPHFLRGCHNLEHIDLAPLANVRAVREGFLQGCSGLAGVDLGPLCTMVRIPDSFLRDCGGLRSIDLSPLIKVRAVGAHFLALSSSQVSGESPFSGITSIDLTPLRAIDEVPDGFLMNCWSLTEIDLSPLSNVRKVGNDFLHYSINLTNIDLASLCVTQVGDCFLCSVSGLRAVSLSHLNKIGSFFLAWCTELAAIDLAPLRGIDEIPEWFLAGCTGLTEVDLSPLVNVKVVGNDFLNDCGNVKTVTFPPQCAIEVLKYNFLRECSDLKELDLSPLVNVYEVGPGFLFGTSVPLAGLPLAET